MKAGYPCVNRTAGYKGDRTFQLKSYSEWRLIDAVTNDLDCLAAILTFNVNHDLLFFRITSDSVPFSSHPICQFDWRTNFKDQLSSIGGFIKSRSMLISMHPDQYTVLNSLDSGILARSIKELRHHTKVFDALGLDVSTKIQLHVGGVYRDKNKGIQRFIEQYRSLDNTIRQRLAIENDEQSYTVDDCMRIYAETGVPITCDAFHHELTHQGSSSTSTLANTTKTWQDHDGIQLVEYSYHRSNDIKVSRHTESIDTIHFERFLTETQVYDFDIMLVVKDKEESTLRAIKTARKDR